MEKKPPEVAASQSSTRWLIRLALLLAIVSLAFAAAGLWLLYLSRAVPTPDRWGFKGFSAVFAVLSAVTGAIICSRHPRNPVGWLFNGVGLQGGIQVFAENYAVYALLYKPGTPGGMAAGWVQHWVWVLAVGLFMPLLLLLFPDGNLLSRRWRHLLRFSVFSAALAIVTFGLLPGPLQSLGPIENPFGIPSAKGILEPLMGVVFAGMGVSIVASGFSLSLRLRRARGEERKQLQWVVYAGAIAALTLSHSFIPSTLLRLGTPTAGLQAYSDASEVIAIAGIALIFPATGIAMMKYRLYDIDLVINRTLVYVPLTALLAGVYIAVIGIFKALLTEFTGKGSDAAVALTTILVVALLTPLKNNLQTVVDRYFKETREPSRQMALLQREVQSVVLVLDMKQLVQRLLDTTVAAFDAEGGSIHLDMNGVQQLAYSRGSWDGTQQISIPPEHDGRGMGTMVVGPRGGGGGYSEGERDAIRACAGAVARALTLREGGPLSQGS